eukprot:GHVP01005453.1.p1 GENE.GHVP01005453.1~~GHVP01005453.1.p1  ORF type:complete len:783 (+),score=105.54 GHVP01005453.1:14-2362(+)
MSSSVVEKQISVSEQNVEAFVSFDGGWSVLSTTISRLEKVLLEQLSTGQNPMEGKPLFSNKDYSSMYTLVYNMCTQSRPHNWAARLYSRYSERIQDFLTEQILPDLVKLEESDLLSKLNQSWKIYEIYTRWMQKFFMYLDRHYVKANAELPLAEKGKYLFTKNILSKISKELSEALIQTIHKERQGELINENVMKDICQILLTQGTEPSNVYWDILESNLISATCIYYQEKAKEWLSLFTFSEYLDKSESAIQAEDDRSERYLLGDKTSFNLPTSKESINSNVVKVLLTDQQSLLWAKDTGPYYLLHHDKRLLRKAYTLLKRHDVGLELCAENFLTYCQEKLAGVVSGPMETLCGKTKESEGKVKIPHEKFIIDAIMDQKFLPNLVDNYKQLQQIAVDCFDNDPVFLKQLQSACTMQINENGIVFATLLSYYFDWMLRRKPEGLDSELLSIFSYLSYKDSFIDTYRILMARRLVANDYSYDAEFDTLEHLKVKCGSVMTAKLEGMLADCLPSADRMEEFHQYCIETTGNDKEDFKKSMFDGIDFSVRVFNYGHWPHNYGLGQDVLPIPRSIKKYLDMFQGFYTKYSPHRKLRWSNSMSTVVLSWELKDKIIDITSTVAQAVILVLFNDEEKITFDQLLSKSGLPDTAALRRTLGSMMTGRHKILLSDGNFSTKIPSGAVFSVNENFEIQGDKLKLPVPVFKAEESSARELFEADRNIAVRAKLVNVMKKAKETTVEDLEEQVGQSLDFEPTVEMLRDQLKWCLDREYLSRDESDQNLIRFMA